MRRILALMLALAIMGTGLTAQAKRDDSAGGAGPGMLPGSVVPRGTPTPTKAEVANAAKLETAIRLENARLQNELLKAQITNAKLDTVIKAGALIGAGAAAGAWVANQLVDTPE